MNPTTALQTRYVPATGQQTDLAVATPPSLAASRELAQSLATSPKKAVEVESFTALRRLGDSAKSFTSKFLLAGAFLGATLSVVMTFFFNLRSIGLICAVPTAMAFYIAHHLKKSLEGINAKFLTDPLRELKEINASPQILETDSHRVLQGIEDGKKIKPDKADYAAIREQLSKLKHLVEVQMRQYIDIEDERSLGLSQEMQSYLHALEGIKPSQALAA